MTYLRNSVKQLPWIVYRLAQPRNSDDASLSNASGTLHSTSILPDRLASHAEMVHSGWRQFSAALFLDFNL